MPTVINIHPSAERTERIFNLREGDDVTSSIRVIGHDPRETIDLTEKLTLLRSLPYGFNGDCEETRA